MIMDQIKKAVCVAALALMIPFAAMSQTPAPPKHRVVVQMSEPQGQRAFGISQNGVVRNREAGAFGLKAEVAREGAFETQSQRRVKDGPGSRGRVRRERSIAVWRKILYLV